MENSTVELEKNIISGSYPSSEKYTEIHYKLLAEDFLETLRDDFIKIRQFLPSSGQQFVSYGDARFDGIRVAYDAVLVTFRISMQMHSVFANESLKSGSLIVIVVESVTGNQSIFLATAIDFRSDILSVKMTNEEDVTKLLMAYPYKRITLHEAAVYFHAYSGVLERYPETYFQAIVRFLMNVSYL